MSISNQLLIPTLDDPNSAANNYGLTILFQDTFDGNESAPIASPRASGMEVTVDTGNRESIEYNALVFDGGLSNDPNIQQTSPTAYPIEEANLSYAKIRFNDGVFIILAKLNIDTNGNLAFSTTPAITIVSGLAILDYQAEFYDYVVVTNKAHTRHSLLARKDGETQFDLIATVGETVSDTGSFRFTNRVPTDNRAFMSMIGTAQSQATLDIEKGYIPAVSDGDTIPTATGDFIIQFTLDALPLGDDLQVKFRIQDSDNYWLMEFDAGSPSTSNLYEVVGGVATLRAAGSALSAGSIIYVRTLNQVISWWGGSSSGGLYQRIGNYQSAVNFETNRDVDFIDGGAGVITNAYVVEYSGQLDKQLDFLFDQDSDPEPTLYQDFFDGGTIANGATRPSGYQLTDSASDFSLADGILSYSNVVGADDPKVESAAITPFAGLLATHRIAPINSTQFGLLGLATPTVSTSLSGDFTVPNAVQNWIQANLYDFIVASDGINNYVLLKDNDVIGSTNVTGYKLLWVYRNFTPPAFDVTHVTRGLLNSGERKIDTMALGIANALRIANSLRTTVIAGSLAAQEVASNTGDWVFNITVTTLASDAITIALRLVNASNRWEVDITSAGLVELYERVSGVRTLRGSGGALINGDALTIRAVDDVISIFTGTTNPTTRIINYTSASNYKTESNLSVITLGTGGALDDATVFEYQGEFTERINQLLWKPLPSTAIETSDVYYGASDGVFVWDVTQLDTASAELRGGFRVQFTSALGNVYNGWEWLLQKQGDDTWDFSWYSVTDGVASAAIESVEDIGVITNIKVTLNGTSLTVETSSNDELTYTNRNSTTSNDFQNEVGFTANSTDGASPLDGGIQRIRVKQ